MVFHCPKCDSTRFRLEKQGAQITIMCERSRACGWSMGAMGAIESPSNVKETVI